MFCILKSSGMRGLAGLPLEGLRPTLDEVGNPSHLLGRLAREVHGGFLDER